MDAAQMGYRWSHRGQELVVQIECWIAPALQVLGEQMGWPPLLLLGKVADD